MRVIMEDFSQNLKRFKLVSKLGEGGFGSVILAKTSRDEFLAIKVLKKAEICKNKWTVEAVQKELQLLKLLKGNPFFTQLKFADQDDNCLFVGMEYSNFGDLHHIQKKLPNRRFDEKSAKTLTAELLVGIDFLHQCGIVHRDLKPENILIARDMHIKIADFNCSTQLTNSAAKSRTVLGTPGYIAPEILTGKGYKYSVDYWQCGIIFIQLITGRNPYYDEKMNDKQYADKIFKGNPDYDTRVLSDAALKFGNSILTVDPAHRPNFKKIKKFAYFNDINWNDVKTRSNPPIMDFNVNFLHQPLEAQDTLVPLYDGKQNFPTFKYELEISYKFHEETIEKIQNSFQSELKDIKAKYDQKFEKIENDQKELLQKLNDRLDNFEKDKILEKKQHEDEIIQLKQRNMVQALAKQEKMNVHSSPKRLKLIKPKVGMACGVCDKILSDRHSLRKHVNAIHLKIKPHQCQSCGYSFAFFHSLQIHIQRRHNVT